MNDSPINPLPGYILDTHKEFPVGYVSKRRRERNKEIARKKKKMADPVDDNARNNDVLVGAV